MWAKNKDADLLKWFCIEKIKGKTEMKKMVLWMSFLMIINAQVKNTKINLSFDKIEKKYIKIILFTKVCNKQFLLQMT